MWTNKPRLWQSWQTMRFCVQRDKHKVGAGGCRGVYRDDPRPPTLASAAFWPPCGDGWSGEVCWKTSPPPSAERALSLSGAFLSQANFLPLPVSTSHPSPSPGHSLHHTLISSHSLQGLFDRAECFFGLGINCPVSLTGEPFLLCEYCHYPQRTIYKTSRERVEKGFIWKCDLRFLSSAELRETGYILFYSTQKRFSNYSIIIINYTFCAHVPRLHGSGGEKKLNIELN